MLIYFDESYDQNHDYLLLGALFNPHSRYLHKELSTIKNKANFRDKNGSFKEIKYSNCKNKEYYQMCKLVIDSFMKSTSWFRAIVIRQELINYDFFGKPNEPEKIKKARAYKKFAEMLISFNTENLVNGVLLVDDLTRCDEDKFIEVMKDVFATPNCNHSLEKSTPTLKEILPVESKKEQYQVIQICDLLLGCILNNLYPTQNRYKNEIRQYLVKCLQAPSLLPDFWGDFSKMNMESKFPKYGIWYWKPKAS
ncbi:MAG: DUF3800 domain-containing protein [Actinobacteria bacterium]|nr:DUF3800 domain-containing protein [Actinomycetota bacterium]